MRTKGDNINKQIQQNKTTENYTRVQSVVTHVCNKNYTRV
jgi:hypothetical protein